MKNLFKTAIAFTAMVLAVKAKTNQKILLNGRNLKVTSEGIVLSSEAVIFDENSFTPNQ